MKVGSGSREPAPWYGELWTVRTEADLFTNLFRGREAEVLLGSMGVVEPVCEKANDPLECEITAELGREVAGLLESRDFDTLLDKRRSHFWD